MERTRSSRSAAAAAVNATAASTSKKNVIKEQLKKSPTKKQTPTRPRRGDKRQHDSDDEEFFGFSNSDIPQPIIIKTEPVEEGGDDCVVVEVSKASKPLAPLKIKKEKLDDDDLDTFHGFSLDDLPKPIVIKEEPVEDDVSAERATALNMSPNKKTQSPRGAKTNVPLDELHDELASPKSPSKTVVKQKPSTPDLKVKKIVTPKREMAVTQAAKSPTRTPVSSPKLVSPAGKKESPKFIVVPPGQEAKQVKMGIPQPKFVTKPGIRPTQPKPLLKEDTTKQALPSKIQIISQNGEKIELITQESEGEFDTGDETDEDHEFTVIVEDNDEGEVTNITSGEIHIDGNNVIQADSIEDIIAQFEGNDTAAAGAATRSVSCPNCKKCFVSSHFLNLHISNSATMCDLCNTQCCSQVNLRNHKNLECDLSKRKRNIDLIAKETALLGRKPIEPEKYYNMPLDEDDDETEVDDEDVKETKPKQKLISNARYECSICGKFVKILESHMKFAHGGVDEAQANKFKCSQCGVWVADLGTHSQRHHGDNKSEATDEPLGEIVRCRNAGCDLFFNNGDEVAEHIKREHSEEVKLPCGMGGCDEVFDNRGALKRHRSEAHPELEEFKPVDLEPDDPDRVHDMSVACPVCEKKFKHKNTCTVHIKTNHLGWSKRKLFECPDCFRSFDNKRSVDSHREAVHLGIRTVCPLCEKPVTRLDLHVRMVHTDLPEWPCPDCGKKFKRKFDLNRHRVTVHLGVRNFPCDLCGKRFADMKDMNRHKNAVHYGMKIKWNSRKYKEKNGKLKPKKTKEEDSYKKKQNQDFKLEENTVTYIETVETSAVGEEIITMENLEGQTVILQDQNGTIIQAPPNFRVEAAEGDSQTQIYVQEDADGSMKFVVMSEEDAGEILGTEHIVEVQS